MSKEDNKPKLTPVKVIRKLIISYDLKIEDDPPVYYAWQPKRQPKWFQTESGLYPESSHFTVDYDKQKREWYVGYIVDVNRRVFATIDDITGRCDIESI
jgi:hypothetical protein